MQYKDMLSLQLKIEATRIQTMLDTFKSQHLNLNMARGKPSAEQLALSIPMLDVLNSGSDCAAKNAVDCRNYGELSGIVDAKKLFSRYMGVAEDEIIIGGSSSLSIMYDTIARAMLVGVLNGERPWSAYDKIKFLCPVPGYDRHFTICEFLGIEMINVPLTEEGPDMDMVEALAAADTTIKGIWCVPKYSNPLGSVYSNDVVKRMSRLRPKAKDFRIFWDNAYAVHKIYEDAPLLNLLTEAKYAKNEDMVYMFGSTSKISFPGAGVAFFCASRANIAFTLKQLCAQSISADKMNMLRHVRFFKDMCGILSMMEKHAAILRPRFDIVLSALENELAGYGVGNWTKPKGGYFVTYMAEPGCATRIVELCKGAGVTLTQAGATHPYHRDPEDKYIRIAPSFPSLQELKEAMKIFCVAAKLAYIEKLSGIM